MNPVSVLARVKVGENHPVRIMGVINVSPESFYKKSVQDPKTLARAVHQMEEDGADFIDVGAMSTAPYLHAVVSENEEAKRISWAVSTIRKHSRLPISIDSTRAVVAHAGLEAGAVIINDISGFHHDRRMISLAKKAKGVILMAHPSGLSGKEKSPHPLKVTKDLLGHSLGLARRGGIPLSKIVIDPGIGFFRNLSIEWWRWDLTVLKNLSHFKSLGAPLLIGLSRKSFIGHLLGNLPPERRLYGSLAGTAAAVINGASLIRTHDVSATREAIRIAEALRKG